MGSEWLDDGLAWSLRPEDIQHFDLPALDRDAHRGDTTVKQSRVLLVEDNPADAGLVREALEEYKVRCELTLITNGERAIEFIDSIDGEKTFCPDLVILDLNLPRKAGREVLGRIRAVGRCERVPVVILTSSDSLKDRAEAASLGATRYFQKPSQLAEFLKMGSIFKELLAQRPTA
jgi:CheY-like chemotaxis protein